MLCCNRRPLCLHFDKVVEGDTGYVTDCRFALIYRRSILGDDELVVIESHDVSICDKA